MEKKIYISEKKLLKVALLSNVFYAFFLLMLKLDGLSLEKVTISILLVLSTVSLGLLIYQNRREIIEIPKTSKRIFYLLIFYSLIIIVRSFSSSLQDWATNFGNVYMALAWLTPLTLFLGLRIENWNVIFKVLNIMFSLMFLAAIIHIIGFRHPEEEWNWLLRPSGFILLTMFYKYNPIKKLKFIILLLVYIYVAVYTKFRFEFIYLTTIFFFLTLDKLLVVKLKKRLLWYILLFFFTILTYIFTVGYESLAKLIALIIEYQDSRTFLFVELFQDLSISETYFGRGSLGTYYSDFFRGARIYYERQGRIGWPGDVPLRNTIEVGYLQMILKGGYILLILNILLYSYSIYLSIFRSNNKFTKRLGYYILTLTILGVISLRPAFTPTFILLWVSIGTVLSKRNRQLSDAEINQLIKA